MEFVEALTDVGRGEVAVERAGDLVDVDADAVELAQHLGAEHMGAAAVLGQGKVRGEPAGDEGEDDVGGEAGFALVAVLGGGLLEGGVLVGGEAQRADADGSLGAGEAADRRLDALDIALAGRRLGGGRGLKDLMLDGTDLVLVGASSAPASRSGAPWRWPVSATPGAETPEDRP